VTITTTSPADSGDAGTNGQPTEPDYAAKYNGLQSAFQKRQNEWAQKEQSWASERSEFEAKMARLAEYETRDAAEREEREMEAQYEALRERFEPGAPTPRNPNSGGSSQRHQGADDGSADWLLRKLEQSGGKARPSAWPD
jgi:hypothetical protein